MFYEKDWILHHLKLRVTQLAKTLFLGGKIKGSLIDAMNTLAKRFEFKVKYVQARGFDNLVKNVRSMVPNVICYLFYNFLFLSTGIKEGW